MRILGEDRLNAIIDELNQCRADMEDVGETFIDLVIDEREDEGLPPFTPVELEEAKRKCDEAADAANALDNRMEELREEYFDMTGKYPHYCSGIDRYEHPWSVSRD